jgi:EpsI family protein
VKRPLLLLVVFVAVALGIIRAIRPVVVAESYSVGEIPLHLGGWTGRETKPYADDVVSALGVDDYVNRTYALGTARAASVYVGYYRSQRQGSSMHSPLNCLPGAGWEPLDDARVRFAGGAARRVLIQKGAERYLVLYWYQTAARIEGDEYRSRVFTMIDTIRSGRNDAALVRVIVPVDAQAGGESRALARAADLAGHVEREVRRLLFSTQPL